MTRKYARTVGEHNIVIDFDDGDPSDGKHSAECYGCGTRFDGTDHPVGHLGRAIIAWVNEHAGICRFTS